MRRTHVCQTVSREWCWHRGTLKAMEDIPHTFSMRIVGENKNTHFENTKTKTLISKTLSKRSPIPTPWFNHPKEAPFFGSSPRWIFRHLSIAFWMFHFN